MDGRAWKAAVHGVAEGRTRLSDFTFTFHFHALEKEMATHSSVLAWRIPGTVGPDALPSNGVAQSWTRLKQLSSSSSKLYYFKLEQKLRIYSLMFDWHYYICTIHSWEKAMASRSSTLAWRIPWMEEPGRLQSMGSLRVGPDWGTSLSLFTFIHWRRKW